MIAVLIVEQESTGEVVFPDDPVCTSKHHSQCPLSWIFKIFSINTIVILCRSVNR